MRADTDKQIQQEMAGVLTAISIVSKRLASRLLQLDSAEKPEEGDAADEKSQCDGEKEVTPEKGDAAPSAEISLEMVRAKLAALMQSGKQAEVKALLLKHGGEKLSDIPEHNYPDLLKEAEAI